MADAARATVTIPGVTPDTGVRPEPESPRTPAPAGGWDTTSKDAPRSPLEGLRRLAGPKSRGGGGGGSRPRRERPGGGRGRIDLRNTWQILAGSILIPLGVVFILMAWYGAAHTPYVQQQIPYLVSGAFAGLGCIFLGGLLYWAHWLYRMYDQADLHHEEQLQVLVQTMRALSDRMGSELPPPPSLSGGAAAELGRAAPAALASSPGAASYVATQSGSVYHLPDCPVVAHHPEGLRTLSAGALGGLDPCRICLGDRR
jgi:hypothetical protein